MINMGGQKPKTGGNWLLTDPYLQRCNECFDKKKKKINYNEHENEKIDHIDVEILQLRAKFQTTMVLCMRFIWITNSSDHSWV